MATRVADASRNAMVNAVVDAVDAGAAAGTIKVYTGTQPADADDAVGGGDTLLVTFTLNDPAFDAAASGAASLDVAPAISASAAATGTAGWFRLEDSDGTNILDGAVGEGSGELDLDNTDINSGQTVTINSLTVTAAASV